jgi:hypothetical protein
MLRMAMMDPKDGDMPLIAIMREFVEDRKQKSASTRDFQRIAEKHFLANRNPDKSGKLDWFFDQWVHGQEIPSYEIHLDSHGHSQFRRDAALGDLLGGRMARLGTANLKGSEPAEFSVDLPSQVKQIVLNYTRDVLADKVETVRK